MTRFPLRKISAPRLAVGLSAFLAAAPAGADRIAEIDSEVGDIILQAQGLESHYLQHVGHRGEHYAEERLIDGENFYRLGDYQRAAIIFMDIIENYSGHAAYPDALYYFADSLFQSRDYFGAREWFSRVLDEAGRPGIGRFRQKAISRLIEIGIHTNDFEGIERHFSQLGQTPDDEVHYIKGKYLYFRGDNEGAQREFSMISREDPELFLKSRYFVGAVLTKQSRYDEAIEVFEQGASHQPVSQKEKDLVDLMCLGMGRIYYEKDFVEHASEAYQRINQYSPYFDVALYEAASVLIRAGDTIRAERTLEVLTLAVPDSKYMLKAKLLRGNLLLRTGRYDEAEKVFEETIQEFTPVMDQLDKLMAEQRDTRQFFSDMMERSLSALDVTGVLPPLVVKWVGEEPAVRRALGITSDLGSAREHMRETERLVRLLEAVIDGPSAVNAIPTLREALRRARQLNNRLGQLRGALLDIEQGSIDERDGEIQKLRSERRDLQKELDELPTTDEEFKDREERSRLVFQRMSQELARNSLELDKMAAQVVALEMFVGDSRYVEGVPEENLGVIRTEVERQKVAVSDMRRVTDELREDVERARYQSDVTVTLERDDEEIRARIRSLADRERALLKGRGGSLGARLDQVHAKIDAGESALSRFEKAAARAADRQLAEMRAMVRGERESVDRYKSDLLGLNREAEEVVGGVTYENFSNVKKRFHELVLKADVGIIDVAWMRKAEHEERVQDITKDLVADKKVLDDEFKEVRKADEE